jgi:hypothetical protein
LPMSDIGFFHSLPSLWLSIDDTPTCSLADAGLAFQARLPDIY